MIAVIGDIHGCFLTLQKLMQRLKLDYPGIDIYSVGDLVDRGNFSYEVIDYFISEKVKFTAGNHDLMFYYFMKQPSSEMGNTWLYNGYEKTVASYGDHYEKLTEHLEYIINTPLYLEMDGSVISHAGISKYYKKFLTDNIASLENVIRNDIENPHGIIWTRDELLDVGKLQVIGHTRVNEVTYRKENNVVYIDTSAYSGNKLTAVIIEEGKLAQSISIPTDPKDIE